MYRRFASATVCIAALPVIATPVLASPPPIPITTSLSPAQRTNIRKALTFSGGGFEFSFNFSARKGTTFEFDLVGNTATEKAAETAFESFRDLPLPGDPEAKGIHLQKLATLAEVAKHEETQRTVLQEANATYQALLKSQPARQAVWLMELGKVQSSLDSPDAEKTWREAVLAAPDSWQAWVGLGLQLSSMVYSETFAGIGQEEAEVILTNPSLAIERLRHSQQNPKLIERGRTLQQEANECLNKAMRLAPRESRVYLARVSSHIGQIVFVILDVALKKTPAGKTEVSASDTKSIFESFEQTGFLKDLEMIVRLSPTEPKFILSAELMKALIALNGTKEITNQTFAVLAERALPQLDLIVNNNTATLEQRIQATQSIVSLQLIQENYKAAEQVARRSLDVLPSDPRLHDTLLVALMSGKKYADARVALQESLAENDAPFRRVILAKTYLRENRLKDAEKALREANTTYPDSAPLILALAIIRLKSAGDEEAARKEAAALLSSLEKSTNQEQLSTDDKKMLSLAQVSLAALSGEKVRAESLLAELEKENSADSDVQAMRAALNTTAK